MLFQKQSNKVKKVINEYDPYKLIIMGAPEDEYYEEVKEIIEYMDKNKYKSEKVIKEEIIKICYNSFGIVYDIDEKEFDEMITKIMNIFI